MDLNVINNNVTVDSRRWTFDKCEHVHGVPRTHSRRPRRFVGPASNGQRWSWRVKASILHRHPWLFENTTWCRVRRTAKSGYVQVALQFVTVDPVDKVKLWLQRGATTHPGASVRVHSEVTLCMHFKSRDGKAELNTPRKIPHRPEKTFIFFCGPHSGWGVTPWRTWRIG